MLLGLNLFLILALPHTHMALAAGEYSILFMKSEDSTASPAFSIIGVDPFDGGLRLFLETDRPAAVAGLLTAGALEAQLSDHQTETVESVLLSLGKAVRCTEGATPVYLDYSAPLPSCDGQPPAVIEYFFRAPVSLGPGRDLAIGQEPDFMWLIEEAGTSAEGAAQDIFADPQDLNPMLDSIPPSRAGRITGVLPCPLFRSF
jgi:hypothetical protein